MRISIVPILALSVIWAGCATIQRPKFEDSNQCFLERTVDSIKVASILKDKLKSGTSIALASIETDETLDHAVVAMIEDQIIKTLVANHYTVIERDPNLVVRMAEEKQGSNYSMFLGPRPIPHEAQNPTGLVPEEPKFIPTQLPSCDNLLSYRVQELGILYLPSDTSKTRYLKRQGMARLHLRLQDTKTGQILFADNVTGTVEGDIPANFVGRLSDYHYSLFSHEYPLQPRRAQGALKLVAE